MKPTFDGPIACAGCGEEGTHIVDVELIMSKGDGGQPQHVHVRSDKEFGGIDVGIRDADGEDFEGISTNDLWREPAVRLWLSCEHCEVSTLVTVFQHKGCVFMERQVAP